MESFFFEFCFCFWEKAILITFLSHYHDHIEFKNNVHWISIEIFLQISLFGEWKLCRLILLQSMKIQFRDNLTSLTLLQLLYLIYTLNFEFNPKSNCTQTVNWVNFANGFSSIYKFWFFEIWYENEPWTISGPRYATLMLH